MQHLQKTTGGPFFPIWNPPLATHHNAQALSFHILAHSFTLTQNSTLFFSIDSTLFTQNSRGRCSKVRFARRKFKSIVVGRAHGTPCSAKEPACCCLVGVTGSSVQCWYFLPFLPPPMQIAHGNVQMDVAAR